MKETILINLAFSFVLFLIALMFLEGIWHGKGKIVKTKLDIDKLFFSEIKDKRIFNSADQLAFVICLIMACFTLLNGILSALVPTIPNVSGIFIFIAVILSWPIRILFIFIYRNKKYEHTPRIWPFKKKQGRAGTAHQNNR